MNAQPFIDNRSMLPGTAAAMMQPWTQPAAVPDPISPNHDPRPRSHRRTTVRLTGYARS